jgi:hypothetical protein
MICNVIILRYQQSRNRVPVPLLASRTKRRGESNLMDSSPVVRNMGMARALKPVGSKKHKYKRLAGEPGMNVSARCGWTGPGIVHRLSRASIVYSSFYSTPQKSTMRSVNTKVPPDHAHVACRWGAGAGLDSTPGQWTSIVSMKGSYTIWGEDRLSMSETRSRCSQFCRSTRGYARWCSVHQPRYHR